MSETQQEIATPKACKPYSTLLFCALSVVTLAAGSIGFVFIESPKYQTLVLFVMVIAAAVFAIIAFKRHFFVAVFLAEVTIASLGAVLIRYFYLLGANLIWFVLFVCALCLLIMGIVAYLAVRRHRLRPKVTTRYLTYMASLVALSIICKLISNEISSILPVPSLKMSISYVPWVISGIVLGPVGGAITAVIGDILGQLIIPTGGAILPLTLLANGLFPVFPALCYKLIPGKMDWLKVLSGFVLSTVVCTLGLNSLSLYLAYYSNLTYLGYFVSMRLPQLIATAINAVLILGLLPALKRMKICELKFVETTPLVEKHAR